ncbi:MAG: DUF937 domain-containing protein [Novosphingobium sp.]
MGGVHVTLKVHRIKRQDWFDRFDGPISGKDAALNASEMLQQTGAVDAISRELGLSPAVAQSAVTALLPAVLGGFKKQAAPDSGGLGNLADVIGGLGGGGLLDALTGNGPTPQGMGNGILGQIFGSKDVSRTVAGQAAQTTGIDSAILKQVLPLLAMAVAGYLARQAGNQSQAGGAEQGGGLGGILGQVLGGGGAAGGPGGLGSMLDLNGDGNPLDDIIGMMGKLRG